MRKLCATLALLFLFQSCHVGRFFIYNFADIHDYRIFPYKEIKKSETPFHFIEASGPSNLKLPKTVTRRFKVMDFEEALKKSGTVTLIVIRNDSVIYQWNRKGYTDSKLFTSFSMAKSFVSILTGIAIDEGFIKSTDEPIINYLDYLDKQKYGKITIQHLLDMQSGIKFDENYINPFSDIAKYYYGTNIKKYLSHLDVEYEAGKKFRYISINTQILGLILEKATEKSLTEYLQEKLWTPLGMEYDAQWSIDSKKHHTEKAFCCINGRAKDYAKLGRLMLNKGNWNGRQIVSKKYVEATTTFSKAKNGFTYSNLFWHTRDYYPVKDSSKISKPYGVHVSAKDSTKLHLYKASGDYFAQGLLGQYVYVAPKKNMIFVRLGKREGGIIWSYLFKSIAEKN